MAVNNEVGTIQPIEDIGALCVGEGVPLHTDAAQAIGRVQVDMGVGITFATLSSHKIYGPPGIGAICAKQEDISHLRPLMSGGGQEGGASSRNAPHASLRGVSVRPAPWLFKSVKGTGNRRHSLQPRFWSSWTRQA